MQYGVLLVLVVAVVSARWVPGYDRRFGRIESHSLLGKRDAQVNQGTLLQQQQREAVERARREAEQRAKAQEDANERRLDASTTAADQREQQREQMSREGLQQQRQAVDRRAGEMQQELERQIN
ncbi:hypothetical protein PYCC9005_002299 [Savitreella phatthalungensis]